MLTTNLPPDANLQRLVCVDIFSWKFPQSSSFPFLFSLCLFVLVNCAYVHNALLLFLLPRAVRPVLGTPTPQRRRPRRPLQALFEVLITNMSSTIRQNKTRGQPFSPEANLHRLGLAPRFLLALLLLILYKKLKNTSCDAWAARCFTSAARPGRPAALRCGARGRRGRWRGCRASAPRGPAPRA